MKFQCNQQMLREIAQMLLDAKIKSASIQGAMEALDPLTTSEDGGTQKVKLIWAHAKQAEEALREIYNEIAPNAFK